MSAGKVELDTYSVDDYKDYLKNQFYDLDKLDTFYFAFKEKDIGNIPQWVLKEIYDAATPIDAIITQLDEGLKTRTQLEENYAEIWSKAVAAIDQVWEDRGKPSDDDYLGFFRNTLKKSQNIDSFVMGDLYASWFGIGPFDDQIMEIGRYIYSNTPSIDKPNPRPSDAEWDGLWVLANKGSATEIFGQNFLDRITQSCDWTWNNGLTFEENVQNAKTALNTSNTGVSYNLLNLALRYGTLDGSGKKIKEITFDGSTYTVTASEDVSPEDTTATPEHALAHLAIHYYALAVCLEKAYVVMDIMTVQLEQIESLNREIEINNEYLRLANEWYSEYYSFCIMKNPPHNCEFTYWDKHPDGINSLVSYVGNIGTTLSDSYSCAEYDTEGNARKSDSSEQDFSNIDVVEQGKLTEISNAQEAIRMYGDKLSMEQQVATVKLQQLIQNFAACITICSQLCKAIGGDYIRSITNNVRL